MRHTKPTLAASLAAAGAVTALLLGGCAPAAPGVPGAPSGGFVGTWSAEPPAKGKTPTLNLSADGGLGGDDGCNTLGGSWAQDGDGIEFRELFGTQMYCEGVDDWLREAATAQLDGDVLTVFDEDGDAIGELHRAA